MLINLDNKRWINKNKIITIDLSYRVGKEPSLLYSHEDVLLEEFREERSHYFEMCKENFTIDIGILIRITLEQKLEETIGLLLHKITVDDINKRLKAKEEYFNLPGDEDLEIKTKEDYIALFAAAMNLNQEWYTIDIADNEVMNYLNTLLDDEDKVNKVSLSHILEEYYASKEKDEKLIGLINRIERELVSLYRRRCK